MRAALNWKNYELIDASNGEKLERFGKYVLVRPDPQVIWSTEKKSPLWERPDAIYHRSRSGGGSWEINNLPESWRIRYGSLVFNLKAFSFKHTGIFPEQAVNWDLMAEKIKASGRKPRILNLFAYTGGATIACARAGAFVTHVDASKGMVSWAKDNAKATGIAETSTRWIVDDCVKFVKREIRRENSYDAIIMDPPSYGRGPGGEVWKIESSLYPLVEMCARLLSDDPLFFLINSYTTGLSPSVISYMLGATVNRAHPGRIFADEIGLPVTSSSLTLPCGASGMWEA